MTNIYNQLVEKGNLQTGLSWLEATRSKGFKEQNFNLFTIDEFTKAIVNNHDEGEIKNSIMSKLKDIVRDVIKYRHGITNSKDLIFRKFKNFGIHWRFMTED
jgi:hypothetical protein